MPSRKAVYRPGIGDNVLASTDPQPGHVISLQAAWEPPSADDPAWGRAFGRPADLPAGERIELVVVAPATVLETLTLNARPLIFLGLVPDGPDCVRGRCDVTSVLAPRNLLRLPAAGDVFFASTELRRAPLPDSLARVWLEIGRAAPTDHP